MATVSAIMVQWGPNMVSGVLVEWLRKVGDTVREGEPLCRVETEKVTSEVRAPVSGVVAEILARPDDELEVGAVLCRIRKAV
ncbi:MAG: DUF2118 domain-containing protein [Limnochordaceae bacterium]|nr:DUF2118 domain-containing protein [Limnochordaceae bacterium]